MELLRLLLPTGAGLEAVGTFAASQGWLAVEQTQSLGLLPPVHKWRTGSDSAVEYIHDVFLGIHYLTVSGTHAGEAADAARTGLHAWERQAILDIWDASSHIEMMEAATCALGVVAEPGLDMEVLTRLAHSMNSESARVRFLAVRSSLFTGRMELVPALEEIARRDPEDDVRQHALAVARQLTAMNEER